MTLERRALAMLQSGLALTSPRPVLGLVAAPKAEECEEMVWPGSVTSRRFRGPWLDCQGLLQRAGRELEWTDVVEERSNDDPSNQVGAVGHRWERDLNHGPRPGLR